MRNDASRPFLPAGLLPVSAEELGLRILQTVALGVPVLVLPGLLFSPVELPKRLLLEALVIAAFLTIALAALKEGRLAFGSTPLLAPLVIAAAWGFLPGLVAVNPAFALEKWTEQASLLALSVLVAAFLGRSRLDRLLLTLLAAGGAEGVYGILQYAGVDFLPWASSWGARCFGTVGNPIFFAEFLAPLLVFAISLWIVEEDEERKDLMALLGTVMFLALLFSQTRGAWIGTAAGLTVAGALAWRRTPGGREVIVRNRGWLLAFAGFAAAVVITASSTTVFGRNALPVRDRLRDAVNLESWTVRHRIVLWRAGGLMVRSSPLVGVGTEHYRTWFPLVQAGMREGYARKGFHYPPKERQAHNDFVQLAAENGIPGLGLGLWLLITVLRLGFLAARGKEKEGLLAAGLTGGCVCVITASFFNFPFRTLPSATVFWIFTGALAMLERERRRPSPSVLGVPALPVTARKALELGLAALAAGAVLLAVVPSTLADRAFARGTYHSQGGFWEMAEDSFSRSVFWCPSDAVTHYQLARAISKPSGYDWRGRMWDKALRHFERARELGLNDEQLYGELALLYEKKGNLKRAAEMGDIALRICPENADFTSNQAFWLSELGQDLTRAEELSRRAVEAVPGHPIYLWTRGLVLEKMGRRREALSVLEEAHGRLKFIVDGAGYEADLVRDISRLKQKAGARAG